MELEVHKWDNFKTISTLNLLKLLQQKRKISLFWIALREVQDREEYKQEKRQEIGK